MPSRIKKRSFKETEISKLVHPPRKRQRGDSGKKIRRSKRVRFRPLKYWENEQIIYGPDILTIRQVKDKGDAILIPATPQKKRKRKRSKHVMCNKVRARKSKYRR